MNKAFFAFPLLPEWMLCPSLWGLWLFFLCLSLTWELRHTLRTFLSQVITLVRRFSLLRDDGWINKENQKLRYLENKIIHIYLLKAGQLSLFNLIMYLSTCSIILTCKLLKYKLHIHSVVMWRICVSVWHCVDTFIYIKWINVSIIIYSFHKFGFFLVMQEK